jgi:hypothetical protein
VLKMVSKRSSTNFCSVPWGGGYTHTELHLCTSKEGFAKLPCGQGTEGRTVCSMPCLGGTRYPTHYIFFPFIVSGSSKRPQHVDSRQISHDGAPVSLPLPATRCGFTSSGGVALALFTNANEHTLSQSRQARSVGLRGHYVHRLMNSYSFGSAESQGSPVSGEKGSNCRRGTCPAL